MTFKSYEECYNVWLITAADRHLKHISTRQINWPILLNFYVDSSIQGGFALTHLFFQAFILKVYLEAQPILQNYNKFFKTGYVSRTMSSTNPFLIIHLPI